MNDAATHQTNVAHTLKTRPVLESSGQTPPRRFRSPQIYQCALAGNLELKPIPSQGLARSKLRSANEHNNVTASDPVPAPSPGLWGKGREVVGRVRERRIPACFSQRWKREGYGGVHCLMVYLQNYDDLSQVCV